MQPANENASAVKRRISVLDRLELPLSVCLGQANLPLRDVLALTPGSSVEMTRVPSDPVELRINSTVVARGELTVVDGMAAVRITRVMREEEPL